MKTEGVTVIVPVYNTAPYLERCVESLLGQTVPVEIVLVNDGSADGSSELCDRYAHRPNVTVLHRGNGGASAARNAGLDLTETEWVGFVDSDDWVEPHMYEALRSLASDGADITCCGVLRYLMTQKTIRRGVRGAGSPLSGREALALFLANKFPATVCDKLYRKDLFRGLVFPTGRTCEDEWIMPRLLAKAREVAYTDKLLYHYEWRCDSNMNAPLDNHAIGDALWVASETISFIGDVAPDLKKRAEARGLNMKIALLDRMLLSGGRDADMDALVADIRAELPSHIFSLGLRWHRKLLASSLYAGLPCYWRLRLLVAQLLGR